MSTADATASRPSRPSTSTTTAPEIRQSDEALRFLAAALWMQRTAAPTVSSVRATLRRLLEVAGAGAPILPPGFVADLTRIVLGLDDERADDSTEPNADPAPSTPVTPTSSRATASKDEDGDGKQAGLSLLEGELDPLSSSTPRSAVPIPGWPDADARRYEDYVLGKLDADPTIARAADAMARYRGRDRDKALAFLIERFTARSGLTGIQINPSAIKAMLETEPREFLEASLADLHDHGLPEHLGPLYHDLTRAVRELDEALGPEDVFELEAGTALQPFAQRVQLRQVLQAAAAFEARMPHERPRIVARRREVPTQALDEDSYPVGGFSSIATKGSLESLLHSQLVFMEPGTTRPDLFDIKFVREELLYYARDENQFRRQHRSFVFVLGPDLVQARVKDPDLPRQRIVLALALIVALVRRLTDWLGDQALHFEVVLIEPQTPDQSIPTSTRQSRSSKTKTKTETRSRTEPQAQAAVRPTAITLEPEQRALVQILHDDDASGRLQVFPMVQGQGPALVTHLHEHARRSLCQVLVLDAGNDPAPGLRDPAAARPSLGVARLHLDHARPRWEPDAGPLGAGHASANNNHDLSEANDQESPTPEEAWHALVIELLKDWL